MESKWIKDIEALIYYVSGDHVRDQICLGPPSVGASRSDTLERLIKKAKSAIKEAKDAKMKTLEEIEVWDFFFREGL